MSKLETSNLPQQIKDNHLKLKRYSKIDFEAIKLTDLSEREWRIIECLSWGVSYASSL